MVAPNYAATRSALAKSSGLGQKQRSPSQTFKKDESCLNRVVRGGGQCSRPPPDWLNPRGADGVSRNQRSRSVWAGRNCQAGLFSNAHLLTVQFGQIAGNISENALVTTPQPHRVFVRCAIPARHYIGAALGLMDFDHSLIVPNLHLPDDSRSWNASNSGQFGSHRRVAH